MSKLLRSITFKGKVLNISDHGVFVQIFSYKTRGSLFLHLQQITKQKISHPSEVLHVGQEIEFRIISINQKNFRFNISCIYDE